MYKTAYATKSKVTLQWVSIFRLTCMALLACCCRDVSSCLLEAATRPLSAARDFLSSRHWPISVFCSSSTASWQNQWEMHSLLLPNCVLHWSSFNLLYNGRLFRSFSHCLCHSEHVQEIEKNGKEPISLLPSRVTSLPLNDQYSEYEWPIQNMNDQLRIWTTNSEYGRPIQSMDDQFRVWTTNSEYGRPIQSMDDQFRVWTTNSEYEWPIQNMNDQFRIQSISKLTGVTHLDICLCIICTIEIFTTL